MKNKHVKIVATLGPAVDSVEKIVELIEAGVDIFRINLSHATPDEAGERCQMIRAAEKIASRL